MNEQASRSDPLSVQPLWSKYKRSNNATEAASEVVSLTVNHNERMVTPIFFEDLETFQESVQKTKKQPSKRWDPIPSKKRHVVSAITSTDISTKNNKSSNVTRPIILSKTATKGEQTSKRERSKSLKMTRQRDYSQTKRKQSNQDEKEETTDREALLNSTKAMSRNHKGTGKSILLTRQKGSIPNPFSARKSKFSQKQNLRAIIFVLEIQNIPPKYFNKKKNSTIYIYIYTETFTTFRATEFVLRQFERVAEAQNKAKERIQQYQNSELEERKRLQTKREKARVLAAKVAKKMQKRLASQEIGLERDQSTSALEMDNISTEQWIQWSNKNAPFCDNTELKDCERLNIFNSHRNFKNSHDKQLFLAPNENLDTSNFRSPKDYGSNKGNKKKKKKKKEEPCTIVIKFKTQNMCNSNAPSCAQQYSRNTDQHARDLEINCTNDSQNHEEKVDHLIINNTALTKKQRKQIRNELLFSAYGIQINPHKQFHKNSNNKNTKSFKINTLPRENSSSVLPSIVSPGNQKFSGLSDIDADSSTVNSIPAKHGTLPISPLKLIFFCLYGWDGKTTFFFCCSGFQTNFLKKSSVVVSNCNDYKNFQIAYHEKYKAIAEYNSNSTGISTYKNLIFITQKLNKQKKVFFSWLKYLLFNNWHCFKKKIIINITIKKLKLHCQHFLEFEINCVTSKCDDI
ncbi:NOT family protein [Reticulomyxa filosa]|uniref:NOT family protein n=1 Tax=Reticulomyxa filosa TaxID=46433 RepID=X6MNQ5_RETFI|nr:NOT family protein [Reticulomyxa filosa]|eukprot:ETO15067.1 NOT family protein [Reticulomyxa filosa]